METLKKYADILNSYFTSGEPAEKAGWALVGMIIAMLIIYAIKSKLSNNKKSDEISKKVDESNFHQIRAKEKDAEIARLHANDLKKTAIFGNTVVKIAEAFSSKPTDDEGKK